MPFKIKLPILFSLTCIVGIQKLSAMESKAQTISDDEISSSSEDYSADTFEDVPATVKPDDTPEKVKAENAPEIMSASGAFFPWEIAGVVTLAVTGIGISAFVSYLKSWRNERKRAWEESEAKRVQIIEEEQEIESDTNEFSEDPQLAQRALDQYALGMFCFNAPNPDYDDAKKHFIRAANQKDSREACREASYMLGTEICLFMEENLLEVYTHLKRAEPLVDRARRAEVRLYLEKIEKIFNKDAAQNDNSEPQKSAKSSLDTM